MKRVVLCFVLFATACDKDESQFRSGKLPVVECTFKRVAGGPRKIEKVKIEIEEDAFTGTHMTAFAAHYGFDMTVSEDLFVILINEGNFVIDEVGEVNCGPVPKKKGIFCTEDIEVDKNLGVDNQNEVFVKAFEISCARL